MSLSFYINLLITVIMAAFFTFVTFKLVGTRTAVNSTTKNHIKMFLGYTALIAFISVPPHLVVASRDTKIQDCESKNGHAIFRHEKVVCYDKSKYLEAQEILKNSIISLD